MRVTIVTLRHKHWRTRLWRGILAVWLSVSLAVPNSAWGLRIEAGLESTSKQKLLDAMTEPAAGMEELVVGEETAWLGTQGKLIGRWVPIKKPAEGLIGDNWVGRVVFPHPDWVQLSTEVNEEIYGESWPWWNPTKDQPDSPLTQTGYTLAQWRQELNHSEHPVVLLHSHQNWNFWEMWGFAIAPINGRPKVIRQQYVEDLDPKEMFFPDRNQWLFVLDPAPRISAVRFEKNQWVGELVDVKMDKGLPVSDQINKTSNIRHAIAGIPLVLDGVDVTSQIHHRPNPNLFGPNEVKWGKKREAAFSAIGTNQEGELFLVAVTEPMTIAQFTALLRGPKIDAINAFLLDSSTGTKNALFGTGTPSPLIGEPDPGSAQFKRGLGERPSNAMLVGRETLSPTARMEGLKIDTPLPFNDVARALPHQAEKAGYSKIQLGFNPPVVYDLPIEDVHVQRNLEVNLILLSQPTRREGHNLPVFVLRKESRTLIVESYSAAGMEEDWQDLTWFNWAKVKVGDEIRKDKKVVHTVSAKSSSKISFKEAGGGLLVRDAFPADTYQWKPKSAAGLEEGPVEVEVRVEAQMKKRGLLEKVANPAVQEIEKKIRGFSIFDQSSPLNLRGYLETSFQPLLAGAQVHRLIMEDLGGDDILEIVLSSAVTNAIDGVLARVRFQKQSSGTGKLVVQVERQGSDRIFSLSDDGNGIKEDILRRFFKERVADVRPDPENWLGGTGTTLNSGDYGVGPFRIEINTQHPQTGAFLLRYNPQTEEISITAGDREEIGTDVRWIFSDSMFSRRSEGGSPAAGMEEGRDFGPYLTQLETLAEQGDWDHAVSEYLFQMPMVFNFAALTLVATPGEKFWPGGKQWPRERILHFLRLLIRTLEDDPEGLALLPTLDADQFEGPLRITLSNALGDSAVPEHLQREVLAYRSVGGRRELVTLEELAAVGAHLYGAILELALIGTTDERLKKLPERASEHAKEMTRWAFKHDKKRSLWKPTLLNPIDTSRGHSDPTAAGMEEPSDYDAPESAADAIKLAELRKVLDAAIAYDPNGGWSNFAALVDQVRSKGQQTSKGAELVNEMGRLRRAVQTAGKNIHTSSHKMSRHGNNRVRDKEVRGIKKQLHRLRPRLGFTDESENAQDADAGMEGSEDQVTKSHVTSHTSLVTALPAAGMEEFPEEPRGLSRAMNQYFQHFWYKLPRLNVEVFPAGHLSTHLLLEVMERLKTIFRKAKVLDTGAGSGILGLATLAPEMDFGAVRVVATEPEDEILRVVRHYAELLDVSKQVETRKGLLLTPVRGENPRFNVVLYNVGDRAAAERYLSELKEVLHSDGVALLLLPWHAAAVPEMAQSRQLFAQSILEAEDTWEVYAVTYTREKLDEILNLMRQSRPAAGMEEIVSVRGAEQWSVDQFVIPRSKLGVAGINPVRDSLVFQPDAIFGVKGSFLVDPEMADDLDTFLYLDVEPGSLFLESADDAFRSITEGLKRRYQNLKIDVLTPFPQGETEAGEDLVSYKFLLENLKSKIGERGRFEIHLIVNSVGALKQLFNPFQPHFAYPANPLLARFEKLVAKIPPDLLLASMITEYDEIAQDALGGESRTSHQKRRVRLATLLHMAGERDMARRLLRQDATLSERKVVEVIRGYENMPKWIERAQMAGMEEDFEVTRLPVTGHMSQPSAAGMEEGAEAEDYGLSFLAPVADNLAIVFPEKITATDIGKVYIMNPKPFTQALKERFEATELEYWLVGFKYRDVSQLAVGIGSDEETVGLAEFLDKLFSLKETSVRRVLHKQSNYPFPSQGDYEAVDSEWDKWPRQSRHKLEWVAAPYRGVHRLLEFDWGNERDDVDAYRDVSPIPREIQIKIWREASPEEPDEAFFIPNTHRHTVHAMKKRASVTSALGKSGFDYFFDLADTSGVTKVEVNDNKGRWFRWDQEDTWESILEAGGYTRPAAGMEEVVGAFRGLVEQLVPHILKDPRLRKETIPLRDEIPAVQELQELAEEAKLDIKGVLAVPTTSLPTAPQQVVPSIYFPPRWLTEEIEQKFQDSRYQLADSADEADAVVVDSKTTNRDELLLQNKVLFDVQNERDVGTITPGLIDRLTEKGIIQRGIGTLIVIQSLRDPDLREVVLIFA